MCVPKRVSRSRKKAAANDASMITDDVGMFQNSRDCPISRNVEFSMICELPSVTT